jgi:C4-dicarboxylate transporter DctM subunit
MLQLDDPAVAAPEPQGFFARFRRAFDTVEGGLAALALISIVGLMIAEMVLRPFGSGVPGALPLVQHLTLWLAFLGAALAATEGQLLSVATGELLPEGKPRRIAQVFAAAVGAGISALLARASWEFLLTEKEAGELVAYGIPVWAALLVLPISLGLIALRLVWRAGPGWIGRAGAGTGVALGHFLGAAPQLLEGAPLWPVLVILVAAMLLGAPLFAVLGGAAVLLFLRDAVPMAAVPVETYRLAVSPTLPAIPLFTLTGFLLAEGKASQRLVAVFRSLFGFVPGGTAVVTAIVCAFFTVFTGGSGVTILALGALLYRTLKEDGYPDRFALGLITTAGSLGLLLPPALPLILYGIVAEQPIDRLFIGGILPGILMIGLIAAWGVRVGMQSGAGRQAFDARTAGRALWQAKWELFLPVFLVVAILGGFATPVEASALSALYALIVQLVIHRDLKPFTDVPRVLRHTTVLIGGVLIILCVAMGFTSYLIDAQVPAGLLAYVQQHVDSPWVFLALLNLFLLVVGCLMDIFSATVVVVPLIVPLGQAFGVDPIHLGIVFIANLELGYLTPPVGLNLFLASYTFKKPLLEVYRAALPGLLILLFGVLLITYFPFLTTALLPAAGP